MVTQHLQAELESFPYCISTSANKKLVIEEFTSYNANGGLRIRKKFPNGNVLSANYWLGDIHFKGWDGDQFIRGAKIEAVVEGTPANNVMPCGLRFSTNPGDASTPERLRITKDGKVGINDTSPDATLSVGGSTALIDVGAAGGNRGKIGYSSNDLYFGTSSSSGEFIFKNNVTSTDNPASSGTERFRISDGGNVTASTENSVMGVDDRNGIRVGLFKKSGLFPGIAAANNAQIIFYHSNATDIASPASQTYTERFRISTGGGHRIQCDESWHAANLSECNTDKIALNVNKTRQGQTKGIAIGCVGGGSGSTGIQAYDTSNNSANTLELNPFGGNLLYGDTASDLSNDHKFIAVGAKHAFQYDGNAGTYLSVILSPANGSVDIEADARSGNYPDLRFLTTNDEQLRVLAAGHIWKKGDGALWHGTTDINDFSNANRSNYNKVSIRAGDPNDGTSPTNDNSAIKIYPAGNRGSTAGTLSGGIAWQHLDPTNGDWDTYYGAGAQMWMGSAIHDVPGQERSRFNLWMNSSTVGNSNPNNLAIEAYPNGVVRHPKVPAFLAKGGTALSNNTHVVIVGSGTEFNNGGHYSTSNGRFTAPVDGIYHFSFWGLLYPHASGVVNIYYARNGTQYGHLVQGGADSNSHTSRAGSIMMSMSAGDYAELKINRGGTSSVNAYGSQWNMCGFLVG